MRARCHCGAHVAAKSNGVDHGEAPQAEPAWLQDPVGFRGVYLRKLRDASCCCASPRHRARDWRHRFRRAHTTPGVEVRGVECGGGWFVALGSSAAWTVSGSAGRAGIVDVLGWQHDRQPGERGGAGALRRSPRRARHGRQRWCALALTPRGCSATPAAGSGYWCSAGSHEAGEVVSWSGRIPAARSIKGVEIAWVHAPKEVRRDRYPGDPLGARRFAYARESSGLQVRVLTSPDGSNFEEALCWKATGKDGESFTETLMFSRALAQGARRRGAGSAWRCTALRR